MRWSVALGDPPESRPSGVPVADTLETLAWAARACVLRFGQQSSIWELIVAVCGGGLLYGRPRGPARVLTRAPFVLSDRSLAGGCPAELWSTAPAPGG